MNLEYILKLEHIFPNMKHFSFEPGAYFFLDLEHISHKSETNPLEARLIFT